MKSFLFGFAAIILLAGCSKKNTPGTVSQIPGAATLQAPAKNEVCTIGTPLSSTLSTVQFSWTQAANADSFEIVVKNLLTNDSSSRISYYDQVSVILARNTPFSWYVISRSSQAAETTKSEIWKFYNSGSGIVSYAPFPAEIVSPLYGQTINGTAGTVDLTWKGDAVTQDTIKNYDVYLGTSATPPILEQGVSNSYLKSVSISPNTTYYWKVITRDNNGNTSDSGLFQFVVD